MSSNIKTQTFATQEEARSHFNDALLLAQQTAAERNEADPDLNETVTSATDLVNKRYYLTRPDTQEGIMTVIFAWR